MKNVVQSYEVDKFRSIFLVNIFNVVYNDICHILDFIFILPQFIKIVDELSGHWSWHTYDSRA